MTLQATDVEYSCTFGCLNYIKTTSENFMGFEN